MKGEEAEWDIEGTVVLNQNNKAVHAQTVSNRDVWEPETHCSPPNGIGSPQRC